MKTEAQVAKKNVNNWRKQSEDKFIRMYYYNCERHKATLKRFLDKIKEDVLRLEIIKDNDKTPFYGDLDKNRRKKLPEEHRRFLTPFELAENLIKEKQEEITDIKQAIKLYDKNGI